MAEKTIHDGDREKLVSYKGLDDKTIGLDFPFSRISSRGGIDCFAKIAKQDSLENSKGDGQQIPVLWLYLKLLDKISRLPVITGDNLDIDHTIHVLGLFCNMKMCYL